MEGGSRRSPLNSRLPNHQSAKPFRLKEKKYYLGDLSDCAVPNILITQ